MYSGICATSHRHGVMELRHGIAVDLVKNVYLAHNIDNLRFATFGFHPQVSQFFTVQTSPSLCGQSESAFFNSLAFC